jgi:prevent-host-death family protein
VWRGGVIGYLTLDTCGHLFPDRLDERGPTIAGRSEVLAFAQKLTGSCAGGGIPPTFVYICYIDDMSDPVVESMAEVRSHLADVIDRARREETPTIITRRGKHEAVVIDIQEYQRLRQIAEEAEEAWLNRLADEAESEGSEGSVSLEEMAALLRAHEG